MRLVSNLLLTCKNHINIQQNSNRLQSMIMDGDVWSQHPIHTLATIIGQGCDHNNRAYHPLFTFSKTNYDD